MASPPVINVKLHHPLRDELSQQQLAELDKRLEQATISPEALLFLQEQLNREITDSLAVEYNPSMPVVYGQQVYYYKARIHILSDLISHFSGKVR